jgi:hypothetical protein
VLNRLALGELTRVVVVNELAKNLVDLLLVEEVVLVESFADCVVVVSVETLIDCDCVLLASVDRHGLLNVHTYKLVWHDGHVLDG